MCVFFFFGGGGGGGGGAGGRGEGNPFFLTKWAWKQHLLFIPPKYIRNASHYPKILEILDPKNIHKIIVHPKNIHFSKKTPKY